MNKSKIESERLKLTNIDVSHNAEIETFYRTEKLKRIICKAFQAYCGKKLPIFHFPRYNLIKFEIAIIELKCEPSSWPVFKEDW